MTPVIELARDVDLERIVAISNQAAAETTANFAIEPELVEDWRRTYDSTARMYPWLVARAGEGVVGWAKAGPHKARGAYRWSVEVSVYLERAWQGRRVGAALYDVLLPLVRAQGYVLAIAGITSGHVASERLHERLGFRRCATFHRIGWKFGAWHDVGYWELDLQPPGPPGEIRPVAAVSGSLSPR